jgi:glycosyltransferase involved in cell wall biosynthesis
MSVRLRTMEIAIITPSFLPDYNGMTFASLQHAILLRELGHRVAVMSSCPPAARMAVCEFLARRTIDHLPVDLSGTGMLSRPLSGDVSAALGSLVRWRPKVVLVEGRYFWGYHLMPAIKSRGMSIALLSHGSAPDKFEWSVRWPAKWAAYRSYGLMHERRLLQSIDSAGVLSAHEDGDRFRDARTLRSNGLDPVVVGNTSLEAVASVLVRTPGKPGKLRIALVGDMSDGKNQLAAVEVAKAGDAIDFIRFYFSKHTDYSRKVMKTADTRGVENFEYRVGLDRWAIMESMVDIDLILCLSKTEAQPLAVVDGLACGIPFLSTPVGCMSSMRGGMVSEVAGMDAIIRRLADDRALLSRLSEEAKAFYEANHSEWAVKPALQKLVEKASVRGAVHASDKAT